MVSECMALSHFEASVKEVEIMIREEWRGLTSFIVILIIFSAFFAICTNAAVASPEQNVCRDLPVEAQVISSVITVSLDITVGSATYYAIDEEIPSGWTVTGASDGGDYTSESGHVKWVITAGAMDKVYTYTVQIGDASGTYAFSGEYQMEGMGDSASIDCDSSITVEVTSDDGSDDNNPEITTIDEQETTTIDEQEIVTVNDPEINDESSSVSIEKADDTTLKSVATTESPDDSAEEIPEEAAAGSPMMVIVIGAIIIAGYKLKEK